MKLQDFNNWQSIGKHFGRDIEYQTVKQSDNVYKTFLRDKASRATIARAHGRTPESSQQYALKTIQDAGADAVWHAIEKNEPILQGTVKSEPKRELQNSDWIDGANHRHRAQRKIVGEAVTPDQYHKSFRNFVAKHSRNVNKAGPMRDKKNDYQRNPKHKNKEE
jgi:putative protein kinase ArgK-like GTPase of G3E family